MIYSYRFASYCLDLVIMDFVGMKDSPQTSYPTVLANREMIHKVIILSVP